MLVRHGTQPTLILSLELLVFHKGLEVEAAEEEEEEESFSARIITEAYIRIQGIKTGYIYIYIGPLPASTGWDQQYSRYYYYYYSTITVYKDTTIDDRIEITNFDDVGLGRIMKIFMLAISM